MIAYEELAAALERWRIRNGLPGTPPLFADGPRKPVAASVAQAAYAAPAAYAPPPAAAYAPPPVAAYAAPAPAAYAPPAPRTAPPIAPPALGAETIDDEVDVLDEDHLDNDGPDFAMAFDSGAAKRPAMSADDAHEASQIGGTDPGILPPEDEDEGNDVWPEAASYASPAAPKPAAAVVDDDDDGGTLVNG